MATRAELEGIIQALEGDEYLGGHFSKIAIEVLQEVLRKMPVELEDGVYIYKFPPKKGKAEPEGIDIRFVKGGRYCFFIDLEEKPHLYSCSATEGTWELIPNTAHYVEDI